MGPSRRWRTGRRRPAVLLGAVASVLLLPTTAQATEAGGLVGKDADGTVAETAPPAPAVVPPALLPPLSPVEQPRVELPSAELSPPSLPESRAEVVVPGPLHSPHSPVRPDAPASHGARPARPEADGSPALPAGTARVPAEPAAPGEVAGVPGSSTPTDGRADDSGQPRFRTVAEDAASEFPVPLAVMLAVALFLVLSGRMEPEDHRARVRATEDPGLEFS